jgi:hypothetical protein
MSVCAILGMMSVPGRRRADRVEDQQSRSEACRCRTWCFGSSTSRVRALAECPAPLRKRAQSQWREKRCRPSDAAIDTRRTDLLDPVAQVAGRSTRTAGSPSRGVATSGPGSRPRAAASRVAEALERPAAQLEGCQVLVSNSIASSIAPLCDGNAPHAPLACAPTRSSRDARSSASRHDVDQSEYLMTNITGRTRLIGPPMGSLKSRAGGSDRG